MWRGAIGGQVRKNRRKQLPTRRLTPWPHTSFSRWRTTTHSDLTTFSSAHCSNYTYVYSERKRLQFKVLDTARRVEKRLRSENFGARPDPNATSPFYALFFSAVKAAQERCTAHKAFSCELSGEVIGAWHVKRDLSLGLLCDPFLSQEQTHRKQRKHRKKTQLQHMSPMLVLFVKERDQYTTASRGIQAGTLGGLCERQGGPPRMFPFFSGLWPLFHHLPSFHI